jgi:hypothetical protein
MKKDILSRKGSRRQNVMRSDANSIQYIQTLYKEWLKTLILRFFAFLIGGASISSFIGGLITAFTNPELSPWFLCIFVLSLKIEYAIVKSLL